MSNLKVIVASLQSLDICTAALLPSVIAILLTADLNATEQGVLSSFFVDIGDSINTISILTGIKEEKDEEAAKDTKSDQKKDDSQSLKDDQEKIQEQIEELQRQNQELQKVMQELLKELKSINIE